MNKVKFAERTEYLHLYKDTYWGKFSSELPHEVVSARNAFAKKHNLKRLCLPSSRDAHRMLWFHFAPGLDHPEAYDTDSGGTVLIVSPYSSSYPVDHGWVECPCKLYAPNATTYLRTFDNLAAETEMFLAKIAHDYAVSRSSTLRGYRWEFNYVVRAFREKRSLRTFCGEVSGGK